VEGNKRRGSVSKLNTPLIHVQKARVEVPKSAAELAIPMEAETHSGHFGSF
jgi:hypothetical protein